MNEKKWFRLALFNLCVLAFAGFLLRYKINFPLPAIQQANLLHAHSHFAFSGWIGFVLYIIIINQFSNAYNLRTQYWNNFLWLNTLVNYSMIISFVCSGYSTLSIIISTFSILLSYVFAFSVYKSIAASTTNNISTKFIKAALLFLVFSSTGTFVLAYLMATHDTHLYWRHNAVYWYLHFQYNGWFTFSVIGLLLQQLEKSKNYNWAAANKLFWLLFITCIPSYLLAALWPQRPIWVTAINVSCVLLQTGSLFYLFKLLWKNRKEVFQHLPLISRWLMSLAIGSFAIKILLQFFSAHPVIGQLAYGYRPVIIAYLHLVFLAFVSLFIVGFLASKNIIPLQYKIARWGLIGFVVGVFLNELLLVLQGLFSILEVPQNNLNYYLFYNTILLVVTAIFIFSSTLFKKPTNTYHPIN